MRVVCASSAPAAPAAASPRGAPSGGSRYVPGRGWQCPPASPAAHGAPAPPARRFYEYTTAYTARYGVAQPPQQQRAPPPLPIEPADTRTVDDEAPTQPQPPQLVAALLAGPPAPTEPQRLEAYAPQTAPASDATRRAVLLAAGAAATVAGAAALGRRASVNADTAKEAALAAAEAQARLEAQEEAAALAAAEAAEAAARAARNKAVPVAPAPPPVPPAQSPALPRPPSALPPALRAWASDPTAVAATAAGAAAAAAAGVVASRGQAAAPVVEPPPAPVAAPPAVEAPPAPVAEAAPVAVPRRDDEASRLRREAKDAEDAAQRTARLVASRAGAAAAEQWALAVAARDAAAADAAAAAEAVSQAASTPASASRRSASRLPPAPPPPETPLRVRIGTALRPHPEKVDRGGEDAACVRAAANVVAVADGVGGWADEGVDPALYARDFVRAAADAAAASALALGPQAPPSAAASALREALRSAHVATSAPGSATAVVLRVDAASGVATAASLGDSGVLHARGGKSLTLTPPQQWRFNCPRQFGYPPRVPDTDFADQAAVFAFPLRPGDQLVVATDGLWDNCFPAEVAAVAARHAGDPRAAAAALAATAAERGGDEAADTPFARAAQAAGEAPLTLMERARGVRVAGGKLDDVTVVVLEVTDGDDAADAL